ncbi:alpha/beta fold hydrolase [Sorangium sp. So ce269]
MNTSATVNGGRQARAQRRRSGFGLWARRVLLGLLVALVALVGAGALYQAAATRLDQRKFAPPGRLVDVGGRKLHIHCLGQGSPAVILETGMAGTSASWSWVQPEVARSTRACSYDRAGMGWSDPGPEPRDARSAAAELRTLLERAGIQGPHVLVGHSLGGLSVRMFAEQHRSDVAGMVLVDATHPDLWRRLPPELQLPDASLLSAFPYVAMAGLTRFYSPFPVDPELPAPQRAQIAALNASTASMTTIAAELRAIPASTEQVRRAGRLGDMPLVVLTAEDTYPQLTGELDAQANKVWKQLQGELVALSSNVSHRQVPATTHESLVHRQADARATVAAILQVVEAVRTRKKLAR